MSLREKLQADLKTAMKSGNEQQKVAVRMLLSAIRNAEIEQQTELSDEEIQAIVVRQVKQRRDAIEQFKTGDREDLVEKEQAELDILEKYLPPQMTREEIKELARKTIAEVEATTVKQLGLVMKNLMPQVKGKADGNVVSQVVRELLLTK